MPIDRSTLQQKLRRSAAAQYIRDTYGVPMSASTLAKLAVVGGGPPYVKVSRYTCYSVTDLEEWVHSRTSGKRRSTSDVAS